MPKMAMKVKFMFIILIGTIFFNCQQSIPTRQAHTADAEILIPKIVQATQENHFDPRLIDDVFSQDMFGYFIEKLDTQKEFFTQNDIKHLDNYKLTLDEAITNNNFEFFNTAISLLENGIAKAEKYPNQLLDDIHDFSIKEDLEINVSNLAYAPHDKALKDRWRKKLKKYILDEMYVEEKNNSTLNAKKRLENAKEKIQKLLAIKFDQLKATTSNKRIETYANAFLKVQDYQSHYLSPKEKSSWDAAFTRSFVGIGARLEIEEGYPKITKVYIGGAAWKAKSLEVDEIILKVKENDEGAVDLVGKSIEEIISLIKGEKGTSVHLTVKSKDGLIREVVIVRDKIEIDLAMSFLLEDSLAKQKIGYIRLPRFYAGDSGSAAHVLDEIETLKANKVGGIIFDVRNNQGGSVSECRDLIDYFLEDGIYMQSKRSKNGEINQFFLEDPSVQYQGELLVLTNSKSGSASELFSGTLQDYRRALIVGGDSTYGKGSMQYFIDVNEEESDVSNFGQIKMTVGQFYTASGQSPQSTGITPDITLIDDSKYVSSGERGQPFSMPADVLPKIEVSQNINIVENIDQLKIRSNRRTKTNKRFLLADKKAKLLLDLDKSNVVELEIEAFKKQKDLEAGLEKQWEGIFSGIKDFEVSFDKRPIAHDSVSLMIRERWIKQIKSDPYIYECYQIINDMIG